MKKSQLTLIELLISMAIFTVMISLLIKAFQVSSDVSSRLEEQTQVYDQARLALNLITDDLNKTVIHELKKFESDNHPTTPTYSETNKSLYFYAKADATDGQLCFFTQSQDTNSTNSGIKYLKAINYRIATENAKTGLYRYEKNYDPNTTSNADITDLFNNNENHLDIINTADADDTSLIIQDDRLIDWAIYVEGTNIADTEHTLNNTRDVILKELKQIRVELKMKEVNQSETTSLRTFSRTIFLNK